MIDLLASLHARFYGDRELATDTAGSPAIQDGLLSRRKDALWSITPAKHSTRRPPSSLEGPCAARCSWPAAMRALAVLEGEPQGLMHSDVHIGNWYRTAVGKMGHATANVFRAPLVAGFRLRGDRALTPDDRRKWEKNLLVRYLERFAELTGTRPDFDRSFLYYRQQMVHDAMMWTITLCPLAATAEHLHRRRPRWRDRADFNSHADLDSLRS